MKIYASWFPGKEKEATFFKSWEECKIYVDGVSGIRYRGFPDREHAKEFLGIAEFSREVQDDNILFADKETGDVLHIYVDGSYREGYSLAGWGWVALLQKPGLNQLRLVGEDKGVTSQPAMSRNIDGEINAVLEAVKWLEGYLKSQKSEWGKTTVVIHYDYQGIESWAIGKWKARQALTQDYQKKMQPYRNRISFKKVIAHAGKYWNEYVDRLAKEAINEATQK